ncbi:3-hydroxyacyl-CoA dehydrogenase NAD-binding domain-containing protein [Halolamina sp.]|jgi:leucine dehydrogenase|uniref:3-hydroxyacyl-CoA dehydrogenase NAD-binding domain-containing protein n=1 Tax=Halolamina sp. TaxID=1940283 RepID=UPI000677A614
MEACCDLQYDDCDVSDLHVVVHGIGDMGVAIVRYLAERGTQITVADPNQAAVNHAVGERSEREDRPTNAIADEVAEERIEAVSSIRVKVTDRRVPDL